MGDNGVPRRRSALRRTSRSGIIVKIVIATPNRAGLARITVQQLTKDPGRPSGQRRGQDTVPHWVLSTVLLDSNMLGALVLGLLQGSAPAAPVDMAQVVRAVGSRTALRQMETLAPAIEGLSGVGRESVVLGPRPDSARETTRRSIPPRFLEDAEKALRSRGLQVVAWESIDNHFEFYWEQLSLLLPAG